ncbi:hypothetical protein ZHS_17 [Edwardsiella phage vB_EpM_ZHS]|jgi:hypothetical protein|nr:hypothetical protein ZHS_17 [Edwardsiella phage vB_EpM_ZHS]
MPLLDVSFVVEDPMFADTFNLMRRQDAVGANGRTTIITTATLLAVVGTVTQQDPAALMRQDSEQHVPRRIFLASKTAFRPASRSPDGLTQYQPDQILWPVNADGTPADGATLYTVEQVFPYKRYGGGLYECVATSMNAMDVPQ